MSVMMHLTNPGRRRKAQELERSHGPEWTAVSDHARQLIGQSIADNTRAA